ncbi:neural cell adhesion molecule 2-like [Xiphophorus hellerii]|uniref:neural cell adhesion molecule 2-like n=1 Tax=Xiphophorus hellerii TaxID=8084 RepID=UPI0013B4508B|nr:neural cell adhesion molecule 2-like [Xiphophorus hellerii]
MCPTTKSETPGEAGNLQYLQHKAQLSVFAALGMKGRCPCRGSSHTPGSLWEIWSDHHPTYGTSSLSDCDICCAPPEHRAKTMEGSYCTDSRDNVRLHFQTTTNQPKRVQCPGDAQIPILHGEEPDRGAAKGLTLELAAEALPTASLQVSISLHKVELSVGESKFFICTAANKPLSGPTAAQRGGHAFWQAQPASYWLPSLSCQPTRQGANNQEAIGEPVRLEWFNPLGERIVSSKRMNLQAEASRSRLIIYNAIIEDAGIYRCQATDASGHTEEASVVLEIYQRLTFRDVKSPQEFRHGETAEVVCDVISSPVPAVVWYYQDKEITEEHHSRFQVLPNNNLQIRQVTKADEGVYRCEASVEARGEIDFVDIAVVVNVPPSLSVFQQSFNATADYQESVTFTCITSGSPDPLVTWHRKGQQLEPSEKYIFSQLEGGHSMLTIRNIRQADGGTFSCKASNKAGFQERELLLKVFVQPHITQLKNVTAVEGSAAMISCVAEGEPLPDISWRRASDGQTFVDGDKVTELHIKQAELQGASLSPHTGPCHSPGKQAKSQSDQSRAFKRRSTSLAESFVATKRKPFQTGSSQSLEQERSVWSRDGRFEVRGRHGKSVLTISGVRLSDLGRFDCEAQSRIGGHQKSMFLDIEYIPKFLTNHTIYYSWEGNPVNISCDVMSNPPATMLWRRERFTISEGTPHMQIYRTDEKSVLEVTPMSDRDFGRYNCTARNNIGVRYQEFILAQADVPSNPYSVRLSAVSQRLATVTFMKPDSHGGVPISFYLVQYKELGSIDWRDVKSHSVQTTVVLTGLEPNTTYEVRVAAVNGKGQGEFSHTETFQTLPIREPSPPAVHGQRGVGKAYRLGLVKQDDGGMPIVEYIVKYKTDKEEQWMTKLVPGANDFAMLQSLQWNTRYEVEITARNVKGLSEPTFYQFFMPQKPDITAESLFSGLGLGAVVGLGLGALLLLLVLVDVSCFFLRHCGLLMCITRTLCSKKTATSGKGKEMEEGKAAYLKLPLKEENGKESLKPDTIEIKVHSDNSIHIKPDDSKA